MPEIRDATLADASAVADIYNESIRARDSTMQIEEVDRDEVEAWIGNQGEREGLLVLVDDRVVGFGIIKRYSDRAGYRKAAETSVYLRRTHTGQGLGSRLQAALIEKCRQFDYHHLVAKLWADNEPSVALHRKFGYELVGVQREIGRVDGAWKDVAIMQKLLDS